MLEDPLFLERETVVEIEDKDGKKSKTIGVTVKLSDTPGTIRTPPVDFGESTASILQEMGYTEEDIKEFEEKGVV